MATGGHGEKLSRKQELAISHLLTSDTLRAAAEAIGVHESTLRAWLKLPRFAAEYRERRYWQIVELAVTQLQGLTADAATTLRAETSLAARRQSR